jgi:hypothetical protein
MHVKAAVLAFVTSCIIYNIIIRKVHIAYEMEKSDEQTENQRMSQLI